MGAFPVQSNTVSTAEWIRDGENGFFWSILTTATQLQSDSRAVENDKLVERAAKINDNLTREKLDRTVIRQNVIEIYQAHSQVIYKLCLKTPRKVRKLFRYAL
jgi:hypothetical protein